MVRRCLDVVNTSHVDLKQMQQLMGTINNLVSELQAERAESAKLRALLSRYITTQAA